MTETLDVRVTHAPEKNRYEARVGSELVGFAEYVLDGDVATMTHTETDPAFEGKGVGSALVRGALDHLRVHGRSVRPQCWFVASWIERHEDYASMLATS
ncbi:GNAT family N-acetyltransferase [Gephyromycinifex aptenodytis]|uniref:GNAT family N-acetyltransferase n=1 Tax=Gephyromycinifex aptenodytis TaxID=2716227 RepID=UPI00144584A9|nr:GNAT family N-acetyltransferase [Gephyromycinifex aptenodytis]